MKDGLFQIKSDGTKEKIKLVSILLILTVGGVFTGIFVIPMFEDEGENKQVTIGVPQPKLLTANEGIEWGLNQNDEILLRMDKIIEEQKYQRQLLEEIYDLNHEEGLTNEDLS